jgi:hypothetical protein
MVSKEIISPDKVQEDCNNQVILILKTKMDHIQISAKEYVPLWVKNQSLS